MVSSSKILTVSYGTFSCTAEGFEDPLAVVKDTTHFFRGVISEDRFFGAEPPQFDPDLASEMMRDRIAADHGAGRLSLGSAMATNGAASSGALAAALAAGPARAAKPAPELAGEDTLPDDDTIEATAVLTETPVQEEDTAEQAEAPATPEPALAETDGSPVLAETSPAQAEDGSAEEDVSKLMDSGMPEMPADSPAEERIDSDAAQAAETTEAPVSEAEVPDAEPTVQADDTTATEPLPADDAEAPAEAQLDDPADQAEAAFAADPLPVAEETETPALVQDAPAPRLSDPLGVAAKLERIRAVVAGRFAPQPTPADESTEAAAPAMQAQDAPEESAVDAPTEAIAEETPDEVDDDALASLIGELESDLVADDEEGDSLAAALEDVSRDDSEDDGSDQDNLFSGSIAELMAQERGPFAPVDPDMRDAVARDDDMEDELLEDEDEAPASVLADWDIDAEDELLPSDSFDDAEPVDAPAPVRARVVKVKRAEFEQAVASGELEEITDEDSLADQETSSLSREEEDELARELAAVKAELAGEFDDWDEEYEVETDTPDAALDADEGDDIAEEDSAPFRLDNPLPSADRDWGTDIDALDARASAALGRETAEDGTDADDGDPGIDEEVRDSARKAVKMASPARALLTEREVEDDDTSRLLDQTNSEMDEPEGNRRRSAIAHLRAAVAATKADRLLGRKADAREEQEPYREDLASVVRPRRPQSGLTRTERPAEPAPAPLKLVAEQRVGSETGDEDAPGTDGMAPTPRVTPVRPRRVRRASDAVAARDIPAPQPYGTPGDAEGFASYASNVGAVDLPDLLEAAAAYMSYVEGRDQFSRPQLMTTVRQAELSESSREDRLRSFGQLLREGKIQKTAGGRFTASDRISFKPERAAG